MISLEKATKEISDIINKYMSKMEEKYKQVDYAYDDNGVSLTCKKENRDSIKLQVKPDYSRRVIDVPQSSREYQRLGGHKALIEKFDRHNSDAWKIEVKMISSSITYEIAFSGNENHWNLDDFKKSFFSQFLQEG